MSRVPVVFMASGRGSNFDAVMSAIEAGKLDAEPLALIADRTETEVVQKAKARGLKTFEIPTKGLTREEHDQKVLDAIRSLPKKAQFVVMTGYKRVVSKDLLEAFRSPKGYSRVVNIHPSLLPSFPGLNSYNQAFDYGCQVTGVTVHLVELAVDCGPICAQQAFSISECRSAEEVEAKGLQMEYQLYSETLRWILPEKFQVTNREGRVCVRQN